VPNDCCCTSFWYGGVFEDTRVFDRYSKLFKVFALNVATAAAARLTSRIDLLMHACWLIKWIKIVSAKQHLQYVPKSLVLRQKQREQ
jgi:hypothetical protein